MFPQGINQNYLGANIVQQGNAYLSGLQSQLQQGIIPSLDVLTRNFPGVNSQSPEGQQIISRTAYLLEQAGPLGQERARQLFLARASLELDQLEGSLYSISGNLSPGSPDALQFQARVMAINTLEQDMKNQLNQSLRQDPTRGGAINLNGGNQQDHSLMALMMGMMQMMLSIFQQAFTRTA